MVDFLFQWIKGIVAALSLVLTAWIWLITHIDSKAEAVEKRVMEIRQNDMEHLDKRLNSIDNKLDILIGGRK